MSEVKLQGQAGAAVEVVPGLPRLARESNVWIKALGEAATAFAEEVSNAQVIDTRAGRAMNALSLAAKKVNESLAVLIESALEKYPSKEED